MIAWATAELQNLLPEELAVDNNLIENQALHMFDRALLRDILKPTVNQSNIPDRAVRVATQVKRPLTFRAGHVANFNVSHDRVKFAGIALFIEKIYAYDGVRHLSDFDIPHVDVLDYAASYGVRLDTECAI